MKKTLLIVENVNYMYIRPVGGTHSFYGLLYDALLQTSEFYSYLYDAVILYSHYVSLNNTNPFQLHQNLQRINYTGMFQIIKTKNMFFICYLNSKQDHEDVLVEAIFCLLLL